MSGALSVYTLTQLRTMHRHARTNYEADAIAHEIQMRETALDNRYSENHQESYE